MQDRQEHQPQLTKGIQRTKPAQITPNPDSPQRLVDIAAKRAEGKGIGYERWAKTFNLKQMAKTMNFLSEHGFASPEEVDTALEAAISGQHAAGEKLKELESRITANKELMHQISVYRSGKPLIVTTNHTPDMLENPQDTAHARIYDRLIEMCSPVCFTAKNFRKEAAKAKLDRLKELLK